MAEIKLDQKYMRHLTPVSSPDYNKNIARDLVAVCNDTELPEDFRSELKYELISIRELAIKTVLEYGGNPWQE